MARSCHIKQKVYRGSIQLNMGALPPNPRSLAHSGTQEGQKEGRQSENALPLRRSPTTALRVLSSSCLILRVGKAGNITQKLQIKMGFTRRIDSR